LGEHTDDVGAALDFFTTAAAYNPRRDVTFSNFNKSRRAPRIVGWRAGPCTTCAAIWLPQI